MFDHNYKTKIDINYNKIFFIVDSTERRDIDLVNFRSCFSMYIYTNDLLYKSFPASYKHHSLAQHIDDLQNHRIPNYSDESGPINIENILKRIIKIYWKYSIDFSVVEVGSQYGNDSLDVAAFIKKHGHVNKIYAFDCGMASNLCKYNFKLNLLDDIIQFEQKAVSNFSVPVQLFFDLEHSEDNHISRRWSEEGKGLPSYVVDSITLDDYFKNDKKDYIFKIDTQGTEPLVFQGMKKLFETKPTIIFEFTPWVVESLSIDPVEFLNSISDTMIIFNLDALTNTIYFLLKKDFHTFVKRLSESERKWTDLLLLDCSFIGYQDIVNDLKNSGNFVDSFPNK
jgi:FkbM family methyltransferase